MKSTLTKTFAILMAVIIVLLSVFAAGGSVFASDSISASDWMKEVPDNAYINSLNIPGTHDSGMAHSQWFMGICAETQDLNITEQLNAGARIFDIRLRYGGDNENYLCHGQDAFCCDAYNSDYGIFASHLTFTQVLDAFDTFLKDHPSETIIFTFKHEDPNSDADPDKDSDGNVQNYTTAWQEALGNLSQKLSERGHELIKLKTTDVPTFTMAESRGNVICYKEGIGFGDIMADQSLNDWEVDFVHKWKAIEPFLNDADPQDMFTLQTNSSFRSAYTSCTGQYTYDQNGIRIPNNIYWDEKHVAPSAGQEAEVINRLLLEYPFVKGLYYGWIEMDFISEDLARLVFEQNDFYGQGPQYIETKPKYLSQIRGFCDCEFDDALQTCISDGYLPLYGPNGLLNVNPIGYPIIIGYKLTENPDGAITEIVGCYDDIDPDGYEKIEVDNSLYNYFTRGTGSKTKDTYIYVSRSKKHQPINAINLVTDSSVPDIVKVYGNSESFNLQKGFDFFYGLQIVRDNSGNGFGSVFSDGSIIIILSCIVVLLLAVVLMLVKKNKMLKKNQNK